MKIKFLSVFLTVILALNLTAQNKSHISDCCEPITAKTGITSLVMSEIGKRNNKSFLSRYYNIKPEDGFSEISGTMKISGETLSDSCQSFFTRLNQVSGRIYTFSIRLNQLRKLENNYEIDYVSISRMAETQLGTSVRKDAGIDKVHNGVDLPMPYTGKGILCGIVDIGIDYSHPAFKNETGDSLRIIKAWAQNLKKGSPPAGMNYGVEYSGQSALLAVNSDSITGLHGTITTGAMAAGGYGSNGLYKGAAPGSKIIAVTSNFSDNGLLDAMNYFFTNAKNLNKRGVFNLSWGSQLGPHDGTSLFDQAIDSLAETGAVIVGAAGNWGDDIIHLKSVSGASPVTTSTVVMEWDTTRYSLVDIWGKPNTRFQVQVKAINKTTGEIGVSTSNVSTSRQGESSFNLIFGKDTTVVYIIMTARDLNNNRPNCLVAFLHNHIKTNSNLGISISSMNNEVHAWGANSASFSAKTEKNIAVPGYVDGDNQYTIGELGGTSKSIITVGAHVAQQKFWTIKNMDHYFSADSGKITPYSSFGPTLDGRVKPDLTASGPVLVPVNHFGFDINTTPEAAVVIDNSAFSVNGKTYYWLGDEATSYAAPVVTGSLALILEVSPTISFAEIKKAILENTTNDIFTGNIRSTGSPSWGYGKLNIHKAVSSVVTITNLEDQVFRNDTFWYSNPVQNKLSVFTTESGTNPEVKIYDLYGRIVSINLNQISKEGSFLFYDTSDLSPGQYVIILKSDNNNVKSLKLTKI